jgi:hypothetical protein
MNTARMYRKTMTYQTLYRRAQEMAREAERLPEWKKCIPPEVETVAVMHTVTVPVTRRPCPECGTFIKLAPRRSVGLQRTAVYCSNRCRQKAYRKRKRSNR